MRQRILVYWVVACIAFCVGLSGWRSPAAAAVSQSVNPVADTFVTTGPTGNLTGNNYGAAGALSVAAAGLVRALNR